MATRVLRVFMQLLDIADFVAGARLSARNTMMVPVFEESHPEQF